MGRKRATAAESRAKLEAGRPQDRFSVTLSESEAKAVHEYAAHMGIPAYYALKELINIGMSSDPTSAVVTQARVMAYEETRRYILKRWAAFAAELSQDLTGMNDPNQAPPPGMRG